MPTLLPPNRIFERVPQQLEDYVGGSFNDNVVGPVMLKGGGIGAVMENHVLPRKGFTYPSAARHNNIMKGFFMTTLFSLATFRPTVKWLESALDKINRMADRVYLSSVPNDIKDTDEVKYNCEQCGQSLAPKLVRPDFLQYRYYNACSQELWQLTVLFLRYLGVSAYVADRFGMLIATLIEYEDPYRMRVEDIFSEADPQALLDNPGKEIPRLTKVYLKREKFAGEGGYTVADKFKYIGKFLPWVLWVPVLREYRLWFMPKVKLWAPVRLGTAFRFAIRNADFSKLRIDFIDMYWAFLNPSYEFFGEELEKRQKKFVKFCAQMGVAVEVR